MSSQKKTESAPILGTHMVSTITHPYCQLTITNTSTNQSKLANFVVDTGMWATHSIIKQEVLDDMGLSQMVRGLRVSAWNGVYILRL